MDEFLAEHIKKLELELLNPRVRQSPKKFKELLADDFLEFGMFGNKYSKSDILEHIPKWSSYGYEGSDFSMKILEESTVLLTYKASVTNNKTSEIKDTLRSSIWQMRNDNWQMIFHQGTLQK